MKKLWLFILSVALTASLANCGCSDNSTKETAPATEPTTQPTTEATTQPTTVPTEPPRTIAVTGIEDVLILGTGDIEFIDLEVENDQDIYSVSWSSKDPSVATVDDSGRVDAVSAGVTDIVIRYNQQEIIYKVKVIESYEDGLTYSTAYTANQGILENNINNGSQYLYSIDVHRNQNCVTVYTYDENGDYTVPVRAMVCSAGLDGATVTGDFSIYYNTQWNPLAGSVYGKYTSGFYGDYLFHSVPYYYASSDTLKTSEYNKLGENASMGCIRMAVADVKWVYDNCPVGTPVYVFDSDSVGPLGKPESMNITDLNNGWDPTDDHSENPYNSKKPVISGASDIQINKGDSIDLLSGVTAVDTCDNDITSKITIQGNVYNNKAGEYIVTYTVTDAMYRTDRVDIKVTVV